MVFPAGQPARVMAAETTLRGVADQEGLFARPLCHRARLSPEKLFIVEMLMFAKRARYLFRIAPWSDDQWGSHDARHRMSRERRPHEH